MEGTALLELRVGAAVAAEGLVAEGVTRGYTGTHVLREVSLAAGPGQVYVLVGAGGSGKSTLVRTLVGQLEPEEGRVVVGGGAAEAAAGWMGYMPQQLGLFPDLSVTENLQYWAALHHMSSRDLSSQYARLAPHLHLPPSDSLVAQLSSGLQRLVSLAAALLHAPRILILDEPVAGLDVLRSERVWSVLQERAHLDRCTVLVATNSIDATRYADRVGFMRAGRLLAEGSPQDLCDQYHVHRLEQVFAKLCLQDDHSFLPIVRRQASSASVTVGSVQDDLDFREFEPVSDSENDDPDGERANSSELAGLLNGASLSASSSSASSSSRPSVASGGGARLSDHEARVELGRRCVARRKQNWSGRSHSVAVVKRQLHAFRRSWILALVQLLLPTLQALVFLLFVGPQPQQLPVGIVQQDFSGTAGQELAKLINATDTLDTQFFSSVAEGLHSLEQGPSLALFVIPANFSAALNGLVHCPACVNDADAQVDLHLDFGDYQVTTLVETATRAALANLTSTRYGWSLQLYKVNPVHGDVGTEYVRFIAPGYLAYSSFCFAMFVSVLLIHWERRHACLDRGFASGLRPGIVVASLTIIYGLLVTIQSLVMLLLTLLAFDLPVEGSYGLLILVMWLCAGAGLSTGILISSFTSRAATALQISVGFAFLLLSLGGVLWPLLAVPNSVVWVAYVLPVTWVAQAFRDVYTRGWGIHHQGVFLAVIVPSVWSILSLGSVFFFLRPRSRLWVCCLTKRKTLQA